MAQVVLSAVGQSVGGPVGRVIGATIGRVIDDRVIGSLSPARQLGPRLDGLKIQGTAEGAPMACVFGRARVAVAARAWLGTPYRHQASVKGVGADCLGLVRGLWREVVGAEPEGVPPYSPDWAEAGGREILLEALERWLMPVPVEAMRSGDVLLFRMSPGVAAKHCAVLSDCGGPESRMIHAYWGRAVVESWMGVWWRRRLVAAFRFPG